MGRPTKGYTRRITLRSTELEPAIVRAKQEYLAAAGVTLSENDTINFLIQCAAVDLAVTVDEAKAAIRAHLQECEDCDPTEPPRVRCAAGVYLRDHWARLQLRADHDAKTADPDGVVRRTVAGRRPLLPPPPGRKSS